MSQRLIPVEFDVELGALVTRDPSTGEQRVVTLQGTSPLEPEPPRLLASREPVVVADWNDAVTSGLYAAEAGAGSAPEGTLYYMGEVQSLTEAWVVQTVVGFVEDPSEDSQLWRRQRNSGRWSPWIRLRWSEQELLGLFPSREEVRMLVQNAAPTPTSTLPRRVELSKALGNGAMQLEDGLFVHATPEQLLRPKRIRTWDEALAMGSYVGEDAQAAPCSGTLLGQVTGVLPDWVIQTVWRFDPGPRRAAYQRERKGGHAWGPWHPLLSATEDLDARFEQRGERDSGLAEVAETTEQALGADPRTLAELTFSGARRVRLSGCLDMISGGGTMALVLTAGVGQQSMAHRPLEFLLPAQGPARLPVSLELPVEGLERSESYTARLLGWTPQPEGCRVGGWRLSAEWSR